MSQVSIGLYRHFKGNYYFVKELVRDCGDNQVFVIYFDVCHPEYGTFSRPIEDFLTTIESDGRLIVDRIDNITKQVARFERVKSLNYQLGSVSTQTLINELKGRDDSPLQDVAVDGLSDKVAYKDYCIGTEYEATDNTPYGIQTENSFEDKDKALKYFYTHKHRSNTHIFRRVFVKEEE